MENKEIIERLNEARAAMEIVYMKLIKKTYETLRVRLYESNGHNRNH